MVFRLRVVQLDVRELLLEYIDPCPVFHVEKLLDVQIVVVELNLGVEIVASIHLGVTQGVDISAVDVDLEVPVLLVQKLARRDIIVLSKPRRPRSSSSTPISSM